MEDKPNDDKPVVNNNMKYCKIIAIVTLFLAFGLLMYVVFAQSSPKNMVIGGKKKLWGKVRGGCGCVAPQ